MNLRQFKRRPRAFTLIEALLIVAVLLFFAVMLLPALAPCNRKPQRIVCVNNLKQVGLAYLVWAGDHRDLLPAEVPTADGGIREMTLNGDVIAGYRVMSNELSTPKLLSCPSDPTRRHTTNFARLTRANLSYFSSIDATSTNKQMLLGGDRNITNRTVLRGTVLTLSSNHPPGWTAQLHNRAGNILLADGSVQQVSSLGLREAVAIGGAGGMTQRILIP